jgi:hypothetical protein
MENKLEPCYVVLKHTELVGQLKTVLINDDEGIPYEFDSLKEAERVRDLFQSNTTHYSKYEVKKFCC